MLVKGYNNEGEELEMILDPKYVVDIKVEYLKELLEATIKQIVRPEFLEFFESEDVEEWNKYKDQLMSNTDKLFSAFASGDIHDELEEMAEEIYENNKPQYFPVDVYIAGTTTIYVKARNEDEVREMLEYGIDAGDIVSDCSDMDYEINDFDIGSPEDEKYTRYRTTYDAQDYI